MLAFDTLIPFLGLAVLLALTPGPDNIFVLVQSAQHGWRTGVLIVIGLCLGVVVHTCAVALGLAAVIVASPMAFSALKWAGASYLIWLAWGAWRAPSSAGAVAAKDASKDLSKQRWPERPLAMIGRGMVMNLSNPKVLMFFLAFLPQFANPALGPIAPQIAVLGLVFTASTLLVFGAIAYFSGFFGTILQQSERAQTILNRVASVVFAGLALRLVLMQRLS